MTNYRDLCVKLLEAVDDVSNAVDLVSDALNKKDFSELIEECCSLIGAHDDLIASTRAALEKPERKQKEGLYGKYVVLNAYDESVVPYPTFILRADGKDKAAIAALRAYALATRNMELKKDLMNLVDHLEEEE